MPAVSALPSCYRIARLFGVVVILLWGTLARNAEAQSGPIVADTSGKGWTILLRTEPPTRVLWDHLWNALFFEINVLEHALPTEVFDRARRELTVILEYEGTGARTRAPAQLLTRSAARSVLGPAMLERWRGEQAVILFGPQAYLTEHSKGPLVILRQVAVWWFAKASAEEKAALERAYQNTLRGTLYRENSEAEITRKSLTDYFVESSLRYLFVHPHYPSNKTELQRYDMTSYCAFSQFWTKHREQRCS